MVLSLPSIRPIAEDPVRADQTFDRQVVAQARQEIQDQIS